MVCDSDGGWDLEPRLSVHLNWHTLMNHNLRERGGGDFDEVLFIHKGTRVKAVPIITRRMFNIIWRAGATQLSV